MSDKDAKPQIERFREMARELGADEGEAAFDEKLRHITRPLPSKLDDKPSKPKSEKP